MNKKNRNSSPIVYSTDPNFRSGEDSDLAGQSEAPASAQQLTLRLDEKHRAGKAVTLVEGFQGPTDRLEELARKLKNLCGSGGSAKDGMVLVQGDHREKISRWLAEQGYAVKVRK